MPLELSKYLSRSVEKHEAVFSPDEEVDTPQRRAQDLGVEPLLVLPDFRRVRRHVVRRWRHVDVRTLRLASDVACDDAGRRRRRGRRLSLGGEPK